MSFLLFAQQLLNSHLKLHKNRLDCWTQRGKTFFGPLTWLTIHRRSCLFLLFKHHALIVFCSVHPSHASLNKLPLTLSLWSSNNFWWWMFGEMMVSLSHFPAVTSQLFALLCYCPAWVTCHEQFFLFAYMYMYIGVCVCTYIHIIHMCIYRYMHISTYTYTVSLKSLRLAAQKRSNWPAQSFAQPFSNISTSPVACKLKTKLLTSVIEADSRSCSGWVMCLYL